LGLIESIIHSTNTQSKIIQMRKADENKPQKDKKPTGHQETQ